jgi:hypothetical protein
MSLSPEGSWYEAPRVPLSAWLYGRCVAIGRMGARAARVTVTVHLIQSASELIALSPYSAMAERGRLYRPNAFWRQPILRANLNHLDLDLHDTRHPYGDTRQTNRRKPPRATQASYADQHLSMQARQFGQGMLSGANAGVGANPMMTANANSEIARMT